jgi:hypothetical protein
MESYFFPFKFSMSVENVTIELILQIKNGNNEGVFLSSKKYFFKLVISQGCVFNIKRFFSEQVTLKN